MPCPEVHSLKSLAVTLVQTKESGSAQTQVSYNKDREGVEGMKRGGGGGQQNMLRFEQVKIKIFQSDW